MYRPLLVLAVGTFAIGTDSFVTAGVLPQIAASSEVGVGAAGQLITGYALTYAVLSPVLAAATLRWSRRRALVTGELAVSTPGEPGTAGGGACGAGRAGQGRDEQGWGAHGPIWRWWTGDVAERAGPR